MGERIRFESSSDVGEGIKILISPALMGGDKSINSPSHFGRGLGGG